MFKEMLKKTINNFVILGSIYAVCFAGYYYYKKDAYVSKLSANNLLVLNKIDAVTNNKFEGLYTDIKYLTDSSTLRKYLTGEYKKIDIEKYWLAYAVNKKIYSQIRLLELDGTEDVKIVLEGANKAYSSKNTENKSYRDYWKDLISLNQGEIYISNFDLNIENNKVEVPYKPVIRIAMPVFIDGEKKAIVAINYDGSRYIDYLDSYKADVYGDLFVVDNAGHWIKNPNKAMEWGNALNQNTNIKTLSPELYDGFSKDEGNFYLNGDLYVYKKIIPFDNISSEQEFVRGDDDNTISVVRKLVHQGENIEKRQWVTYVKLGQGYINLQYAKHYNYVLLNVIFISLVFVISLSLGIISAQKADAKEMNEINAVVSDLTQDIISIADTNGKIIRVNKAMPAVLGYYKNEVIGKNIKDFYANAIDVDNFEIYAEEAIENSNRPSEIWKRRKDGVAIPTMTYLRYIKSTRNKGYLIEISSDITHFTEKENEISEKSNRDPLTNLPNRTLLEDRVDVAIRRGQRNKEMFALVYADLNKFKPINDTYGHEAGDKILIETAVRFKSNLRNSDTVSRVGGDEFVILLDNVKSESDVKNICKILENRMKEEFDIGDDTKVLVGCSFGYSMFPEDGARFKDLSSVADKRMYESKRETKAKEIKIK